MVINFSVEHMLYQGYSYKDSRNKALFNTNDPVLKDTVNVPGNGFARIRFKADNQGIFKFQITK
jgi:FtsP/CotA-like multicopper oxidase with cupredoxin domain